jgi:hypothetical protein|nr:hypothetical protein [uncultured Blautia sp.]
MHELRIYKRFYSSVITIALALVLFVRTAPINTYAEAEKNTIVGKVYEFDEDNDYEFSKVEKSTASDKADTYGSFSVSGKIGNVTEKNGIPSYEVDYGNLNIYYTYSDTLLKADEKSWHLIDDKGKKIGGKKLDEKILKGAIILQTSKDRKNWTDVKTLTNVFSEKPIRTEALYKTTDVQILNGCYYRLIVAYETRKLDKTNKVLFVPVKDYEYRKIAEVYEFYAYTLSSEKDVTTSEQTYALGEKTRVKEFDGYSGSSEIKKDDVHYGWDIGQFFVSGYTDKVKESDGNVVFLKNVGDTVTLWFNLQQDINKLNGDEDLKITADTEGFDQYFETPRINFGKGTLIIRYTDYNNNSSEPQIYTKYLEANATVGSNTKVQLFEEGDYEIALDYEVTSDELIDKVGHYRIFFTFSVRNGNCMVYPLDVSTGSELTNSSMTENGFMLDLAKSRYLQINVKREILTESADGLVEDTRANGPAKDGAKYVDEGIYTITATNQYTNQTTTKKIYVGTNNVLKAFMTSGLSIEEINKLVSEGATIDDEGIITLSTNGKIKEDINVSASQKNSNNIGGLIVAIVVVLAVALSVVIIAVWKKRKNDKHNESMEDEQ